MKKLISAMLALALAAGMAACGENSGSSKAESKAASEKTADTSVSEPAKEAETTTTTTEPEKEESSFFTADEEKIKSDLQENYDFLETAKLTIDNVTIDKRMTTEETKEDIVYITADFTGPMCKGTLKGQAKYLLFNEGWGYDSFESEEVTSELTKEPTIEDCHRMYEVLVHPEETGVSSATEVSDTINSTSDENKYEWYYVTEKTYTDNFTDLVTDHLVLYWNNTECLWHLIFDSYSNNGKRSEDKEKVDLTGGYLTPDLVEVVNK